MAVSDLKTCISGTIIMKIRTDSLARPRATVESTRQDVLKMSEQLDKAGVANKGAALCQAAGPDANQKLAPLVREIGWSHNLAILECCKDPLEREFYLRMHAGSDRKHRHTPAYSRGGKSPAEKRRSCYAMAPRHMRAVARRERPSRVFKSNPANYGSSFLSLQPTSTAFLQGRLPKRLPRGLPKKLPKNEL